MASELFNKLESQFGLPSGLLDSVWSAESGRGKNMRSPAGAMGHFQFMPATAKEYGLSDPSDLAQSATAAARKFADLSKAYKGDTPKMLAAYNWGNGNLDRNGLDRAPTETRNYIKKVSANMGTVTAGRDLSAELFDAPAATAQAAGRDLSAELFGPTVKAPQKPASPTDEMSFGQSMAAGVGKFVADTATGVGQLVNDAAAGLENMAPAPIRKGIDWLNEKMGSPGAQAIQERGRADIAETRKRDASLMETGGGKVGYVLGGVATAPFLPAVNTIKGAAAAGGALGLAQPALSWGERAGNASIGAAAGGAGQAGVNALARVVRPNTAPQVNALMREGVTPTPGQIMGGAWKRAEEGLTSLPIAGDAIKAGQRRAMEDLNRAAFNRSLKPIGEKLPPKMLGREAVDFTYSKLGDAYSALLPKMTTQADNQFTQEISSLKNMVGTGAIDPKAAAAFDRILQNDVLGKFQGQASITGKTLKQIEGDLTEQIKRFGISTDADQRLVGDALKEVQSTLRGLVQRTNPQNAAELKAINEGYANFKRVQRAASGLGAEDGVFSPAQLQNAVKAMDRSKDKARFSEGNALMQDLSESAKTSLGNKVPDSGTPYRVATALGASGGAATLLGSPAGAAMLAAPLMYSKAGQAAMATLLARRPQAANQLAELIRLGGPYAGQGSAAIAVQK